MLKKLTILKDPLFAFLLIGGMIFIVHDWRGNSLSRADRQILVSLEDQKRLASLYAREAGALPNADDMQYILTDYVQQQVLAREARRLGLDHGDTVVARRLAQKMTFMMSDLASINDPDETVLRAWFETRQTRFEEPARTAFRHIYFSDPEDPRLSELIRTDDQTALTDWQSKGDPFILQREYNLLPHAEIVRLFGSEFAAALQQNGRAEGVWTGPVSSVLGAHLVQVTARKPAYLPDFDAIRPRILSEWRVQAQQAASRQALSDLIADYEIIIEAAEDQER